MKQKNRKDMSRKISNDRKELWENHRVAAITYLLLRLIVIVSGVVAALRGDYENVFICVLTLILFMLPSVVEHRFGVELPDTLEIVILFFIFATQILGELSAWYVRFHGWDTLMHTINGFLCAAVGFSLVDLLNRSERIGVRLSPFYLALVAFCFSMTVGVVWEFFEYGMDRFFLMDMQKDTVIHTISSTMLDPTKSNHTVVISGISDALVNGESLGLGGYLDVGLNDTMKDLFVNFIGALVFSIIGFFYVRGRAGSKFAERFIPVVLDRTEAEAEGESTPEAEDENTD